MVMERKVGGEEKKGKSKSTVIKKKEGATESMAKVRDRSREE